MRIVRLALAAVAVLAATVLVGYAVRAPPPPPPVAATPRVAPPPEPPPPPPPAIAPVAETPPPVEPPPSPAVPPADPPAPVAAPTPAPTPAPAKPTPAPKVAVPAPAPAPVEPPPEPKPAEPEIIAVAPPPQPPPVDAEQTVRNTIRLSMTAFETCYQNSLRRDSRIKGRVMVTVHVDESGKVTSSKLLPEETTIKDEGVLSCITARMKGMRFPPLGEEVEVTLPLSLVPRL